MQYAGSPLGFVPGLDFTNSISAVSACAALLIVGLPVLAQRGGGGCWRWRWLDSRPLRWLGARSYGFYPYQLGVMTELAMHARLGSLQAGVRLPRRRRHPRDPDPRQSVLAPRRSAGAAPGVVAELSATASSRS
jgi:peptidoglycan/LPS O-acetylase OafA/YrhL